MIAKAVHSFFKEDKKEVIKELFQLYETIQLDLTLFTVREDAKGLERLYSTVWSEEEIEVIQKGAESVIRYYGSKEKDVRKGRKGVIHTLYHPLKQDGKTKGLLVEECFSKSGRLQTEDILLIQTAFELYLSYKEKKERLSKDMLTGMGTQKKLLEDKTENTVLAMLKADSLYQLAGEYGMEKVDVFLLHLSKVMKKYIPRYWYHLDKGTFLLSTDMELIDVMEKSKEMLRAVENLEYRQRVRISILAGRQELNKDIYTLEESFRQEFEGCIVILPNGELTDYMEKLEEKQRQELEEKRYEKEKDRLLKGGAFAAWEGYTSE
ncbi:MAG: hypothetical protein IJN92_03815 [Lachnospiraceae bacterium]|nr:hypothetical protein [Lachnospiraceae bacterium]